MSEWKKVKLGDYCEITSSKRCLASVRSKNGIPFFCSKEIICLDKGEDFEPTDFIPEELYNDIKAKYGVPTSGDLLLTTRGTNGIPYIYKPSDKFYFADGNLSWFKNFGKELSPQYLYYWFKSPLGIHEVDAISKGTAQKAVPIDGLRRIVLLTPSLHTQNRIVVILSRYDLLIKNYQKQIKLLEEAAQRLYKEWFIDLHFPEHENTNIVDGVPEGWGKTKVGEIAPIITGKKDANFGTPDGEYPFFTCSQEPIKAPSFSFDCAAVLLAGNGDFNVKLYRGKFEAYQRTYVLSPYCAQHLYLLYYTISANMTKLAAGSSGSTIKFLTKGMIDGINLNIPNDEILRSFNKKVEPIQSSRESLQSQLRFLTEARDRLLPKLMSGEIEI